VTKLFRKRTALGAVIVLGLAALVVAALIALVFGVSAFGDEREDGTILYLVATPQPRLELVVAKIAAAVASAPNRQYQPRSPGCSCTGAPSYCHSRSTAAASLSPSSPGLLSTIDTLTSNTAVRQTRPARLNGFGNPP